MFVFLSGKPERTIIGTNLGWCRGLFLKPARRTACHAKPARAPTQIRAPIYVGDENRSGRKRSTRRRKRAVEKLKEKAAKRGKARGSDGSLKPPPAGLKTPPKQMPLLSPSQHAGYERTFVHGSAFVHRHRLVHQSEFVRSYVQVATAL